MKIITMLIAFTLLCPSAYSQSSGLLSNADPAQSSSSIQWSQIENNYVKVIYPDYLSQQASFIANLVEYYSSKVGLTYGIKQPKKFPLILRPEVAQPNGFVTLSPRRSEWFDSSIFTPFIGGLNFYQSLSIHEYRHVNQFDFMYRATNKVAYALFGDFGLSVAIGLGLTPWYLEGDAVWAETHYTDAGRGRSPRFAARLKALVLSNQVPTYDEFLGRTYNTNHPNHYVFGYYLVSRGYQLYGPDFWKKVLISVSHFSFNPYAITNAFRNVSGVDFETFYNLMMAELKNSWSANKISLKAQEYTERYYPMVDEGKLFYIKKTLNSYWGLYQYGQDKALFETPLNPQISRVDLKSNIFAYTQFLPSPRFAYKGYSDLFTYNLKTHEKKHLLKGQRIYHPTFSPDGENIAVIRFDSHNDWSLVIVDLNGHEKQKIAFKKEIISEAAWKDSSHLVAIVQKQDGQKRVLEINLQSKTINILLSETRNNLFALNIANNNLYFEADDKGAVQIFKIDLASTAVSRCTNEPIAAYTPFAHGKKLYFVSEQNNGQELKSETLACKSVAKDFLTNYNYLGQTPSDDYTNPALSPIKDFKQITNKVYQTQPYSEYTDHLRPHSWSFFSGRGIDLSITGNNYLNSLGYTLGGGRDAEEKQPFGYFSLSYSKFYPIFTLKLDYRGREDEDEVTKVTSKWNELEASVNTTLPYRFKVGLYNNYIGLTGGYGQIKYSEDINANPYELSDETLDVASGEFTFYSLKDLRSREIFPSYGILYDAVYKNAQAKNAKTFSSEVFYQNLDLYLPTPFNNNGFKLSGTMEKQSKGFFNYRFKPVNDLYTEYVYSRGFSYFYSDEYKKASADYLIPLLYPDLNFYGWAYLRRIYAKLFFDHTKAQILSYTYNLNSTGAELLFESYLLRKLDITLGVRASHRLDREDDIYDFFIGTDIGI